MNDISAFTIRIPRQLADQIDARAKLNHRKRNGEINALLQAAIDHSVGSDLKIVKRMSDQSQSPTSQV